MRKRLILILSAFVGFALFVSVIYNISLQLILKSLLDARGVLLIPYLFVAGLVLFTLVIKWRIILLSQGFDVSVGRLLMYKAAGFAAAYLTPSAFIGGEGVRAYLLMEDKVPYSKGLSANIVDKSIELTVNILFTVIGTVFLVLYLSLPKNTVLAIVFGLILAIILIIIYYFQMLRSGAFFSIVIKPWKRLHHGFFSNLEANFRNVEKNMSGFFRDKKRAFIQSLVLSFVAWIFMFAEYKLLLLTFGYNASMVILFLVISVTGLAYIFPIPAALGVLEGGLAGLFKYSNMEVGKGIAISIIVRIKDLVISFIGLFYIFNYGIFFKRKEKGSR